MHRRLALLAALLGGINIAAWAWAFVVFHRHPLLLDSCLVAYGLGLRHAVDADHIAAIDNVTRKLRRDGSRPVATGCFFSLGHSTVVVLATVAVALGAAEFSPAVLRFRDIGGVAGTLVSAGFLFLIAAANAAGLRASPGRAAQPAAPGLLGRALRPAFRLVRRSWHMYPLGLLFGLGFDTASEIALLGLSAVQAQQGLPIWSILVLPALFTASMSLVDSADGVLMLHVYDRAHVDRAWTRSYNVAVTFASVLVAVLVAVIELAGLAGQYFRQSGPLWHAVAAVNDQFGTIGYGIITVFAAFWLAWLALSRTRAAP